MATRTQGSRAEAQSPPNRRGGVSLWSHHRLIIGYHGCDLKVAQRVAQGKDALRIKKNSWDWLGHGIYFWEYGPERALDWAREAKARQERLLAQGRIRRLTLHTPAVLGAYIQLGRCFDLADVRATGQLADAYPDWVEGLSTEGKPLPVNRSAHPGDHDLLLREGDCALINWYLEALDFDAAQGRTYYQTVRGVFTEGGPVYPGSGLQKKTHTQIAVRDQQCILGYFMPAGGQP